MQSNALMYLREIESHYPSWYSEETRWTLSAYALYVRDLLGDRDARKAEALLNNAGLETLPMEAIGWLWHVVEDPGQLDAIHVGQFHVDYGQMKPPAVCKLQRICGVGRTLHVKSGGGDQPDKEIPVRGIVIYDQCEFS